MFVLVASQLKMIIANDANEDDMLSQKALPFWKVI